MDHIIVHLCVSRRITKQFVSRHIYEYDSVSANHVSEFLNDE